MSNISQILDQISAVVKKEVNGPYQLFLFGSRATVTNDDKSDIDIGIIPDMSLSTRQLQAIREKIEEIPTLLKIDFIDFSTVSDNFKTIALKNTKDIIL